MLLEYKNEEFNMETYLLIDLEGLSMYKSISRNNEIVSEKEYKYNSLKELSADLSDNIGFGPAKDFLLEHKDDIPDEFRDIYDLNHRNVLF